MTEMKLALADVMADPEFGEKYGPPHILAAVFADEDALTPAQIVERIEALS